MAITVDNFTYELTAHTRPATDPAQPQRACHTPMPSWT